MGKVFHQGQGQTYSTFHLWCDIFFRQVDGSSVSAAVFGQRLGKVQQTNKRSCMSGRFISNSQTLYTTALLSLSSPSGLFQTALLQFLKAALNRSLLEAWVDFPKDFSTKSRHSPLSIVPSSTDSEDNPPTMPCCWQEPWEPAECVIQMDLKVKGLLKEPTPLASSHSWSTPVLPLSLILCLSPGPQEAEEAKKWNDLRQPCLDLFCQYWLFHIGFCSGAVAGKVWKTHTKRN